MLGGVLCVTEAYLRCSSFIFLLFFGEGEWLITPTGLEDFFKSTFMVTPFNF